MYESSASLPAESSGYSFLKPGDILVNIETTGLRPSSCFIFMSGWAVCVKNDHAGSDTQESSEVRGTDLHLSCRTLLAGSRRDEESIMRSLREAIASSRRLILFGAYSFALRFLSERWMNYGDDDFLAPGKKVLCIQKILTPWKERLNFPSLKKYDIEKKLGFYRSERISGEELISVYSCWEKERTPGCRDRLIAHSEEDLRSLFALSRYCAFTDFTKNPSGVPEEITLGGDGTLSVRLSCPEIFPCEASWKNRFAGISLCGSTASFCISAFRGTLKYFLPGKVSEYYYLPEEDCAVHKSVALFVDKDHREKATPATCYVKRSGVFLPLPEKSPYRNSYPVFTPEFRSHSIYAEFKAEKWCSDQKILHLYLKSVLQE